MRTRTRPRPATAMHSSGVLLLIAPFLAGAADPAGDGPPTDLPVVRLSSDPAAALLDRMAADGRREDDALRAFDELVALGDAAVPTLVRELSDRDGAEQIRWIAARALGRIGGDGARDALVRALASPAVLDRLAAAAGLADLRSPAAVPDLVRALGDPAMAVRIGATDALAALGVAAPAADLLAAWADAARSKGPGEGPFRAHLVSALAATGSPSAVRVLVGALGDTDREVSARALAGLLALVGDRSPAGADAADLEAARGAWRTWWERGASAEWP